MNSPTTERYMLFIDGIFIGTYSDLERAKRECYCGDRFSIYKAQLIHSEIREPNSEDTKR